MVGRCIAIVVILGLMLAPGAVAAEDPAKMFLKRLAEADPSLAYEVTLSVAETGESFAAAGQVGDIQRVDLRDRVVSPPSVCRFEDWCAADGTGAIEATVRLPASGETFTMRTRGRAEDLIVARFYDAQPSLAKWFKKTRDAIGSYSDVVAGRDADFFLHKRLGDEGWESVAPVPAELLPVVAAAAAKYEQKRPEIIVRQLLPNIAPPAAGEMRWDVARKGDRLLVSGTFGHYYTGNVQLEFRRVRDHWEYVRLQVTEIFIGV